MCNHSSTKPTSYNFLCSNISALPWPFSSKKHHSHFQLGLLKRKRAQLKDARQRRRKSVKLVVMVKQKTEIEMKNLKLYMENKSILEENERLRKKALLLHEENKALFSQLHNKLSQQKIAAKSTAT